ncbi:PAS domain S-box-containing protein/diguanylate cyclase (GGDEF)-like protein [Vibrio sp. ES.051]|uniref:GGDEF domain-containing protein n=1 Tax=Vibrio sp. ES.051 TaxID=1761909 RepID=UPI000BF8F491|nr:GGDEF domain-containing protein [Vibrio sp. ES.051]PFG58508.1 PAS domain S-box-containing protein/diguanylate cyclase (GGDEF)-like protein [Vibrio sp. ES.051]
MHLELGGLGVNLDDLIQSLDHLETYVFIKDRNSRYLYANHLALQLMGIKKEDFGNVQDSDFFPTEAVELLTSVDARVIEGETTREEIFIKDADGTQRIYLEMKSPIYSSEKPNEVVAILGISTDITKQKELEKRAHRQARMDELTELLNRRGLIESIQHDLKKKINENSFSSLLFIDLNDFKQINDDHGHTTGDHILREVGNRIKNSVRTTDLVSRYGGDEFIVFLGSVGDNKQEAEHYTSEVITRIEHALNGQVYTGNKKIRIGTSIGKYIIDGPEFSLDSAISKADKNMYDEKKHQSKLKMH